jgi:hypothetical protein
MSNAPMYGATALNQFSFKLRGERWNQTDWNTPEMTFDMVSNNPRITVFPNNPIEKEKTRETRNGSRPLSSFPISGRMKWKDFWKFMFLMEQVIEAKEPMKFTMSFKGPKFDAQGQKVKGEFVTTAKLAIYMQMYEKDREKPMFLFKENFWVPVQMNDEDMPASMASKLDAKSFMKSLQEVVGPVAVNYYVPEAGREMKKDDAPAPSKDVVKDIEVTEEGW